MRGPLPLPARSPGLIHRGQGPIYALAPGHGGVLAGTGSGAVLAWRPEEPGRIRIAAQLPASVFALLPFGADRLAVGTAAGELFLLDLDARAASQRIEAHAKGLHALAMNRDGRLLSGGADGCLTAWEERDGRWQPQRRIPLCEGKVRALAPSPDGTLVAAACSDGPVRLLDAAFFNEEATFDGHEGGSYALAWHPAKPLLMSGGKDGHLRAWALDGGGAVIALPAHRSTIYALAFSPDGRLLATASRDKSAKLWDAATLDAAGRLSALRSGHTHSVNGAAWLGPDLITAGDDGKLIRWAQNG